MFQLHDSYILDIEDKIREILHEKFSIPTSHHIILLNGNNQLAIEIICNSYLGECCRIVYPKLEKAKALRKLLSDYGKRLSAGDMFSFLIQYEPTLAAVNVLVNTLYYSKKIRFVDSDVAFPYYDPYNVRAWSTSFDWLGVSGISMLVVDKWYVDKQKSRKGRPTFKSPTESLTTLNLLNWAKPHKNYKSQVPDYLGLPLLLDKLESFDLEGYRDQLSYRREMLNEIIRPENVIGSGPVYVAKKGVLSEDLIQRWDLCDTDFGVLFYLYKGSLFDYEDFCQDAKECIVT